VRVRPPPRPPLEDRMPLRRRSQARTLALQALCLYDVVGPTFEDDLERFVNDTVNQVDVGIAAPADAKTTTFARDLARAAWRNRESYDQQLAQAVPDWPVHRMPPVDRNILRLGLHELLCEPDTPPQVVINEAIELARRFGDADSPAFVNGVLDSRRKQLGIELTTRTPHQA
jgi:transcription antitermination protein NusB